MLFSVTQVPKLTYTCHIVSWLLLSVITKIMLSHERNPWYNSRWSPSHPSAPSADLPEGLTRILVSLSSSWRHHILPELRSHSVNELLIVVKLDQRSASLAIGYTSLKLLVPLNTGWNSTARTVWFWLWCRSGREFFLQHFLVLSFYLDFLLLLCMLWFFFFFLCFFGTEWGVLLWEPMNVFWGGTVRKGRANKSELLIRLKDLKSFIASFAYANKVKALQQISTLEFSSEARPGATEQNCSWNFPPAASRIL